MATQLRLWRSGKFTVTPQGLVIDGKPTFKEWADVGPLLVRLRSAATWAVGDWIEYGARQKAWGDKYDHVLSEMPGLSYDRAAKLKQVSRRFPADVRAKVASSVGPEFRKKLGWSTFEELAQLPSDDAVVRMIKVAEKQKWTRDELRTHVRRIQHDVRSQLQKWPKDTYGLIYADPPWEYEHVKTQNRAVENNYPTMTLDEIRGLDVKAISAPDAVLYLWATTPKMAEALTVVEAWGFTYRTGMVWVKDVMGMGYWARQRHELLLIATVGNPVAPAEDVRPDSVITAPRREHSQKPDEVYDILERCFPKTPKIELFARDARTGWSRWGNELVESPRLRVVGGR